MDLPREPESDTRKQGSGLVGEWRTRQAMCLTGVKLAVLLAIGLATSNCSSPLVTVNNEDSGGGAAQQHAECEQYPIYEQCAVVETSSGSNRYTLLKADPSTELTTLVDFGGPGIAALSGSYRLTAVHNRLQSLGSSRNLLVVEEPWVTFELGDVCKDALATLHQSIASSNDQELAKSTNACLGHQEVGGTSRFGFDSESYVEVIDAIERAEQVVIDQFIGFSFGSVRATYLAEKLQGASVVLVDPFPVGSDTAEILSHRAEKLKSWLSDTPAVTEKLSDVRVASALVAASYGGTDVFTDFVARLDSGSISENEIDDMYRSTWNLYGDSVVSLAYLAYIEEFCQVGNVTEDKSPNIPPTEANSPIDDVLQLYHSPCVADRVTTNPVSPTIEPDCIVVNTQDANSDTAMITKSFGTPVTTYADTSVPHAWFGSLSRCGASIGTPTRYVLR